jgi:hypothetical protein
MSKVCLKCGRRPRVREWGYCRACLNRLRRQMHRDGYLQPLPAPFAGKGSRDRRRCEQQGDETDPRWEDVIPAYEKGSA